MSRLPLRIGVTRAGIFTCLRLGEAAGIEKSRQISLKLRTVPRFEWTTEAGEVVFSGLAH